MAGIRITGVQGLRKALKRNAGMGAVRQAVRQNGAELKAKAQRNAPVDTGTLKRGIGLEIADDGLTAVSAATAEYAPYPEWGTRYQEAQPYMGPAFNEQKERFKQDMRKLTD
ncbi:HK97 gp10 family phage protein [[Clostridium] scindens]|uniref:HK97-gp10 family putative phage morphogenesis protein n=1 Tax=Clostridium scindens (strain JCM 10418 / VPI 12708) TaxID=29347 RepID=UPI00209745B7|nr:HK97-gp10 family putative phage morphogenesis protein [[Clostridium] scindens]MCO7172556.1 HK97 gp10 family phage protein [[Clostridium] scindens]